MDLPSSYRYPKPYPPSLPLHRPHPTRPACLSPQPPLFTFLEFLPSRDLTSQHLPTRLFFCTTHTMPTSQALRLGTASEACHTSTETLRTSHDPAHPQSLTELNTPHAKKSRPKCDPRSAQEWQHSNCLGFHNPLPGVRSQTESFMVSFFPISITVHISTPPA